MLYGATCAPFGSFHSSPGSRGVELRQRGADPPFLPLFAPPSDGNSLRANLDRFGASTKFSLAAGDRQYSSFGLLHHLAAKLTANLHLSDTLLFCEEVLEDVIDWASGNATVYMVQGTGGAIKALAGMTKNTSPETVLDDEDFTDAIDCPADLPEVPRRRHSFFLSFLHYRTDLDSSPPRVLSDWFDSFKIVALFSLGWFKAAADLGFSTWEIKHWNPNHHHVRLGIYCEFSLSFPPLDFTRQSREEADLLRSIRILVSLSLSP